MKKIFTANVASLALCSISVGQGLYNIASFEDEFESSPLQFTAGVGYTFDDNASFSNSQKQSASSVDAFIRAEFSDVTQRTRWDASLQLGYLTYLDDIAGGQDGNVNIFARLNLTHSINQRLRYVTQNAITRALEPDYSIGGVASRLDKPYTVYSTDHSLGMRWSERFATYTGINYTYTDFGGNLSDYDRQSFGANVEGRYQLSRQTVLTPEYRYATTTGGNSFDTDSHYFLIGVEHRYSAASTMTLKGGVQLRGVDGGESGSNLYIEGGVQTRLSERTLLKGFVTYSADERLTTAGQQGAYGEALALRAGLQLKHQLTRDVVVYGGVNYLNTDYDQPPVGSSPFDDTNINYNLGFSYAVAPELHVTGTYNFTQYDSSRSNTDLTRSRYSIGLQTQF